MTNFTTPINPNPKQSETMQYKYAKSRLNAMRKDKLYRLCLKHFGHDTASIYCHYTKAEMISDLLTVTQASNGETFYVKN